MTTAELTKMGYRIEGNRAVRASTKRAAPTPTESRITSVSVWVSVRTESEMNRRDHPMAVHRRKKQQQAEVLAALSRLPRSILADGPYTVVLTRYGKRELDAHDGLPASFKFIVDAVAAWLGVDDSQIRWTYDQEKCKSYAVRINIGGAA